MANPSHVSRPVAFHHAFTEAMAKLKEQYGHGAYSWVEGMTRRTARKIGRKLARQAMQGVTRG